MVNLELYRIFETVAEEENLTKASKKLNLTQPAVTKHIKNLENMLQVKLFIRSNHGIVLTDEGKELYSKIKDAIDLLENAEKKYYKSREINLGTHTTLLNSMFSKCLINYYKEYSESKINRFNSDNEVMMSQLQNNQLDIMFSKKMDLKTGFEKIKFIKLGELHDILIANNNSKWKDKKITLKDIQNNTIYMPRKTSETTRNFFESINCKAEDFKEIKNITYLTMVEILKADDSIGLVTKEFIPKDTLKNDFCILDCEFKVKPIEFGIYINKDNMFDDLKRFIKIVKSYFIKN